MSHAIDQSSVKAALGQPAFRSVCNVNLGSSKNAFDLACRNRCSGCIETARFFDFDKNIGRTIATD